MKKQIKTYQLPPQCHLKREMNMQRMVMRSPLKSQTYEHKQKIVDQLKNQKKPTERQTKQSYLNPAKGLIVQKIQIPAKWGQQKINK